MLYGATEYQQQFEDLESFYYKQVESGFETCRCCGKEVAHDQMTASVTNGIICIDCDLKLPV